MGEKNDGGQAFPHPETRDPRLSVTAPGMSLRDWFAGQALTGILTRDDIVGTEARLGHVTVGVSELAYAYADAMIASRDRSPDGGSSNGGAGEGGTVCAFGCPSAGHGV